MQEIESERESTFWPWVMGLVVLALVVWVAAQLSDGQADTDSQAAAGAAETAIDTARAAVAAERAVGAITAAAFQAWVRDSAGAMERADGGSYAEAGLQRLASALRRPAAQADEQIAAPSANGDSAGASFLQRAERLRPATGLAAGVPLAADSIQRSFLAAADLLADLHAATGASDAAARNLAEARSAAAELDPAVPADQQHHRIYRFFDFISAALVEAAAEGQVAL